MQDASVRSVVFDSSVINPAYPDYDQIRQLVQDAIDPTTAAPSGRTTASSAPATETSASATDPADTAGAATDVADACAYDPVQAEEALAQGQPQTRNG